MENYLISATEKSAGYELLDSGNGEKLERFGEVVVSRPDPQALWNKNLPDSEWQKANAFFKRESRDASWSTKGKVPERWQIDFAGLKFWIKLSAFKHTGLFPEHAENWSWIQEKIKNHESRIKNGESVKILNLFGYTGGATLAAAAAGAEVVHVDGSKVAISWARDNAEISGLSEKPVRWILDDAAKFVEREAKRGHFYDGIVLDPPAFGHGPKGEKWKIEDDFLPLLENCRKILSEKPIFFLVNGYASGYSAIAYKNNLEKISKEFGGQLSMGELTIRETSGRLLPAGIFARWSNA